MKQAIVIFGLVFVLTQIALAMPWQENDKKPTRARRPQIERRNSSYFENVFRDALVGQRPQPASPEQLAARKSAAPSGGSSGGSGAPAPTGNWSSLITAEILQAELKSLSNSLNEHVTSPGRFKSGGNRDVREVSSMIAVLFGVINEFDGEVKWKDIAAGARDAFAQCAQSATTTSTQAYNQAKNRQDDLMQILRGGPFEPPVKPSEEFEWSSVADVSELMKRLAHSYRKRIKPWVASESSYQENFDDLMREAAIVAVIGEVLTKETMENADNDDYVEFSHALRDGALMIRQSGAAKDQAMAVQGAGIIDQSCQNCHAEYN